MQVGYIIDSTTISVDFWTHKKMAHVTHCFLTHAHSDHIVNLNSNWQGPKIVCSKITKSILINMLGLSEDKMLPLKVNQKCKFKLSETKSFDATLIDANHCFGSVMFLFEGEFGTILATGDFRYNPSMFIDNNRLNNIIFDKCYLDTTYYDKIYNSIPSKSKALNAMIRLIENKMEAYQRPVFGIEVNKIGKEDLLIELCLHFQTEIAVSDERFKRYGCYLTENAMNNFSTSLLPNTLFYVYKDQDKFLDQLRFRNNFIILTKALIISNEESIDYVRLSLDNLVNNYIKSSNRNTFKIPYSENSSYNQIIEFIKKLKPREIIPNNRDLDMSNLDQYLTKDSIFNGNLSTIFELKGHVKIKPSNGILCLAVLQDGTLASGSFDKKILIWDLDNGTIIKILKDTGYICQLLALPDGTLASGSDDNTIRIWNIKQGQSIRILKGHTQHISSLTLLQNGYLVSSSFALEEYSIGNFNTIRIWDLNTGKTVKMLTTNTRCVFSLASLPDGTLAIGGNDENKAIEIKNPNTNQTIRILTGHSTCVRDLVVLPDGTLASSSADNTIRIWDLRTGRTIRLLQLNDFGYEEEISSLVTFPNGILAFGSYVEIPICETNHESSNVISYLCFWDTKSKPTRLLINSHVCKHKCQTHFDIRHLAVLPNEGLAGGMANCEIKIWK